MGYPNFSRSVGNLGSLGRLLLKRRNMMEGAGIQSGTQEGVSGGEKDKTSGVTNEGLFVKPNNDNED